MKTDLVDLIDHRHSVQAYQTVGQVFEVFAKHRFEYMAVLEGDHLLGICCKRDMGMLLGSQYGFSLFAQKPIRDHLRPDPVCADTETDIRELFGVVFSRSGDTFYDDVLLLSPAGRFLGLIFTQTLVKLQNRFHRESIRLLEQQQNEIALKNQQIEADLRMSRELQHALLPEHYPVFPPEREATSSVFRFHHSYVPYGIVGGDFFHVTQLGDMRAGMFIADVMGHGVRSALITTMLRALLEGLGPERVDPGRLLGQINVELTKILEQVGSEVMFATACYLVADAEEHTLSYASAGHPPPIHVRYRAGIIETLEHPNPGTILGVFEQAEYVAHISPIEPEDSVFLFTDGIFEVKNLQGQELGLEQLKKVVGSRLQLQTAHVLEEIITEARRYSEIDAFSDDVCLLALDFNKP